MEKYNMAVNRRTALKGIGITGLAAVGVGVGMSGSAAAAAVNIGASNPAQVKNDRGKVTKVGANPNFTVSWENLDDAVGKVFVLIEARRAGGSWSPVFRMTPWLSADGQNNAHVSDSGMGTTGEYRIKTDLARALASDDRYNGTVSDAVLELFNEAGRPDYENADYSDMGGVDATSYLNGVSMGSAQQAENELADEQGLPLVNNVPENNAGYYGAAGNASALNAETDGAEVSTEIQIRYTFELQRPNISQVKYTLDFSEIQGTSQSDFEAMSTEDQKQFAAEHIDGLEPSDIDTGNSAIVMNGEDGNADFQDPTGIPYSSLVANKNNHVGVISTKAAFTVTANNEEADSGVTGGTGATAE